MKAKSKRPKEEKPPLQPNPWDVLPYESQGDAEPTDIYTGVGAVLTQWEKLDQLQARMFGFLVGSRLGAAAKAIGLVQSSTTRRAMLRLAAEVVLKDDPHLLEEIVSQLDGLGKLAARRNEIAHGIVSHHTSEFRDEHGTLTASDEGHFLVPAAHALTKRNKKPRAANSPLTEAGTYAYTAAQVMTYAAHFASCYLKLVGLQIRIGAYCEARWPTMVPLPPGSPLKEADLQQSV